MSEVSIQTIATISPAANADKLEIVTMKNMGWECVVQKGLFQPGDRCVYFSIDACIPTAPTPEWIKPYVPKNHSEKTLRVRMVRLRGNLSQGLVLPVTILPSDYDASTDLGTLLGVTHYEKPVPAELEGQVIGPLPGNIPRTQEINVMNQPGILPAMTGKVVYVSQKCDGTSFTAMNDNGVLRVFNRRWEFSDGPNIYWDMVRKYKLNRLPPGIAIQAELVGPRIHKNHMGLDGLELRVFDVWDIVLMRYQDYIPLKEFCERYSLPMVKVYEVSRLTRSQDVSHWFNYLKNRVYDNTTCPIEGIVVRSCKSENLPGIGRASFKLINPVYATDYEE